MITAAEAKPLVANNESLSQVELGRQDVALAGSSAGARQLGRGGQVAVLGIVVALISCGCAVAVLLKFVWRDSSNIESSAHGRKDLRKSLDIFLSLGVGNCINVSGVQPGREPPMHDVKSNAECERLCSDDPNCSGYMTEGSTQCRLWSSRDLYPSSSDGAEGRECFWRHHFKRNSSSAIRKSANARIPKIIWGFWQNLVDKHDGKFSMPNLSDMSKLPPFVDICVRSWKKLNPEWEIRLLDETSKFKWLAKSDLPIMYETLDVQHRADSIRLAVIEKHGGVWLDASVLLLKPIDHVLGNDLTRRTFFTVFDSGGDQTGLVPDVHERRIDATYYAENWFLSSPPRDPLFQRVRECVLTFYSTKGTKDRKSVNDMHQYSHRQFEELNSLRINAYLSTHACIFKTLDEDAAMERWWKSSAVRKLDTRDTALWWIPHVSTLIFMVPPKGTLVQDIVDRGIMKFFGYQTTAASHKSERELICGISVFSHVLRAAGLNETDDCEPA